MSRPGCQVPSRAAAAGPAYRLVRGGEGGGVTSTGAVITGAARLTDHHNRSRALLPSFLPPPAHTDSDDGSGGKCTDLTPTVGSRRGSAPRPGSRLRPTQRPLISLENTGAPTALWFSIFLFKSITTRGRCTSLCQPGSYYGGVSIPQSLLAPHPVPGAFGDHQRCHRPRGTGNGSAAPRP